jgi:magnesium transporter
MVHLIQYNAQTFEQQDNLTPAKSAELINEEMINWLDIDKAEKELVEELAKLYNIHPLITEDILDTDHLPKFEAFEDHLFLSLKMLRYDQEANEISQEHLNIVVRDNLLITFQEGLPGDVFDELRVRLSQGKGLIRRSSVEYLLYHCLDAVVDNYKAISEELREQMEQMEAKLIQDKRFDAPSEVTRLKKRINTLRRYTIPLWDSFNQMRTEGSQFFHGHSKVYFQDISDHIKFLLSFFDTSREILRDIMDLYQTNVNNEMNRVMKTLTVVSAIFIPLTFLAGVYGMNFDFMPELHYKWGYPLIWGLMGATTITMIFIMRHKKWL